MVIDQLDRAYRLQEKKAQKRVKQQQRCSICGEKIPGKIWVVDAAKGLWACTRCNSQRPGQ